MWPEMARIVQAAGFRNELDMHPASPRLRLICRGFPLATQDDYETTERASFTYDVLYASIAEARQHTYREC